MRAIKKNSNISTKIQFYSQEEGMTDQEIADILNISRRTVLRAKKKNNIPKKKLSNRKDKSYICNLCREKVMIKRSESRRLLCPQCLEQMMKGHK